MPAWPCEKRLRRPFPVKTRLTIREPQERPASMTDTETKPVAMQTPSRLPPENGSSEKPGATGFCKTDPDLIRLLEKAAKHKMTPRETWIQRVSFAYGQMMDAPNPPSKEEVERQATKLYGPCPD